LVVSAGPSSSALLTGFARPAFGFTRFNPGHLSETALRASQLADSLD